MTEQEAPKPRSLEEIEAEYRICCGQVGDKSYRVDLLTNEVRALYRRMFQLNQESAALKEEAAKAAKENPV